MGTAIIKRPVPDWAERQSARMSKITNDGLTRSGTGCFIVVPIRQQWASKGLYTGVRSVTYLQCRDRHEEWISTVPRPSRGWTHSLTDDDKVVRVARSPSEASAAVVRSPRGSDALPQQTEPSSPCLDHTTSKPDTTPTAALSTVTEHVDVWKIPAYWVDRRCFMTSTSCSI